jgi:hypothetical protein
MNKYSPGMVVESVVFTVEEHLKAQLETERRAHALWCAGGCRCGTALKDWLRAEREVLEQFIWAYARQHALRPFAKPETSCAGSRRKTETMMKRVRTSAIKAPQSKSAWTMFDKTISSPYPARKMTKPVNFYHAAPSAQSVYLVGDFNEWNPTSHPMRRRVDGCWFIEVQLPHGHHRYQFLVDDQPVLDPQGTGIARNERNERVSLLAVS